MANNEKLSLIRDEMRRWCEHGLLDRAACDRLLAHYAMEEEAEADLRRYAMILGEHSTWD